MASGILRIAMLSEVFAAGSPAARLARGLTEAQQAGADLVVLPELPCNTWSPATRELSDQDAEPPNGTRHRMQAAAARQAAVALLGGAIVVDPVHGARHNTALLFDAKGQLAHSYRKVHIPHEPGFWEQAHYTAGTEPPRRIDVDGLAMPIGIQLCSDLNRPTGSYLLGAQGVEIILAPRATEAATYERWELLIRANAITSCCYVLSVNRPGPENGVALGGPSVAVAPDGAVIARTEDRLTVVELDRAQVDLARQAYPGYLSIPASLYAAGWQDIGESSGG